MKMYRVTLRLELDDDLPPPDEWDWEALMDLEPHEDVTVLKVE